MIRDIDKSEEFVIGVLCEFGEVQAENLNQEWRAVGKFRAFIKPEAFTQALKDLESDGVIKRHHGEFSTTGTQANRPADWIKLDEAYFSELLDTDLKRDIISYMCDFGMCQMYEVYVADDKCTEEELDKAIVALAAAGIIKPLDDKRRREDYLYIINPAFIIEEDE